jgi:hypothetical protein
MKLKLICVFVLVLALIAALVSGCGTLMGRPLLGRYSYTQQKLYEGPAVKVIPIWIDKGFGEADRLAIDDAIQAWNYALNGYIQLKVVDTNFDMEVSKIVTQVSQGGWLFMKVNSDNKIVPSNDKGYWTIGFTEQVGGHHLYLVRDRLANEDIFGVTLHEIGHLMGSNHVGERLMYPHYNRARFRCIDYTTVATVAKYREIPVGNLNYCIDKDISQMSDEVKKPDGGPVLIDCPVK